MQLVLQVLDGRFAIARLGPDEPVPEWAWRGSVGSVTRTPAELSVVCDEAAVPTDVLHEPGWACLQLVGPFAFGLTGVLLSVLAPLAEAGVGIFAVSTFDTDAVLVKADRLPAAVAALRAAGHTVHLSSGIDEALLRRAVALADEARTRGDHPFGALLAVDGRIVAEAHNRVNTAVDVTAHAETELVRVLQRNEQLPLLANGVVYASCEPCPMCVGAMLWAGARRVVFGLTSVRLYEIATAPGAAMLGFTSTAAMLGAAARPTMDISGPWLEDEAAASHAGFWY